MPTISCNTLYTTCSIPGVGCYVYDDAALTIAATAGYYSNGTACFTVSGGQITAIGTCSGTPDVLLDLYYEPSADGGGGVTVALTSDTPIDGYVTVYFTWFGELGSSLYQSLTLGPSATCSSNTFSGAIAGENVFNFAVDTITDASSTQTFSVSSVNSTYTMPC